jgi:hypothetical protein
MTHESGGSDFENDANCVRRFATRASIAAVLATRRTENTGSFGAALVLVATVSGAAAPAADFVTCHAENNGTNRTAPATMMLIAARCGSTVTT